MVKWAVLVVIGTTYASAIPSVPSHPLHSSFTEVSRDAAGRIEISARVFTDDFAAALDSLQALPSASRLPIDSIAARYFQQTVELRGHSGTRIPVVWCGMRTEHELTWICGRTRVAHPGGELHVRNALLFDRFSDQVNIVRRGTRTVVLSRRTPGAVIE